MAHNIKVYPLRQAENCVEFFKPCILVTRKFNQQTYLSDITKIQKLIIYLFAAICLTNCATKKQNSQWDTAEINAAISRDSIYRELDKQPELFSALETQDSSMKRTSDVSYFSGHKLNLQDDKYAKFNNCRAYFFHSDTLSINIGIGNGFGGQGFIIRYKSEKFYTEPYFSTDVISPDEVEPTYKIVYQKLILDKASYSLGDSLYGYIDFKSVEFDKENNTTEHFGKGYFRTKVTKL